MRQQTRRHVGVNDPERRHETDQQNGRRDDNKQEAHTLQPPGHFRSPDTGITTV